MGVSPKRFFIALPDPSETGRLRRLQVLDWQPQGKVRDTLVCIHGLSRNAHDFDFLAGSLVEDGFRVIAASMAGRGESDWLSNPADYNLATYSQDCLAVLGQCGITRCSWLGTSMGGMIGMGLAALPEGPISRLILNDIGAALPVEGLNRIAGYVGNAPGFAERGEAENWLRVIFQPFGIPDEAGWRHMFTYSLQQAPEGYRLAYDPAIGDAFRALADTDGRFTEPMDFSQAWQAVRCPVLILRGGASDILPQEVAENMLKDHDRASLHTFPGIGHAPALMAGNQIQVVRDWLADTAARVEAA